MTVLVNVPVTVVPTPNINPGQVVTFVFLYFVPELQELNTVLVFKNGDGVVIGFPLTTTVTTLLYVATVGVGATLNTLLCFNV